jgi:hypothetical protein
MSRAPERLDSSSRTRPAGPRPEDHALLRRLENEIALETALAGTGIDDLPERASGAVELARQAGGEAEVQAALARHGLPLRTFLLERSPRGLPPALVHHLAVLSDHALEAALRSEDAAGALDVPRAMDRTVAAWLELGREPSHLLAEAGRAAGPTVSGAAIAVLLDTLPLRGLERCRALAAEGLLDRTRTGARAVRALRRALVTIGALDLPAELERRARDLVRGALDDLAMRWLVRFRDGMDELLARAWAPSDAAALFAEAAESWSWLDQEPELERHVLTALPDVAWPVYRQRKMRELGEILAPIMPLAWALEGRVLRDRAEAQLDRELPYVAPCAQALVFWAEIPREVELALPRIERAYALCPTLRNARIVLAHVLCDRAEHTLARRELFPVHPPRNDVERAEAVFPELSRLADLKKRVGIAA